jgi:hypothetical protein
MSIVGKTRGISYLVVDDKEVLDWGIKRFTSDRSSERTLEFLLNLISLGDVNLVLFEDKNIDTDTEASHFLFEIQNHLRGREIPFEYVTEAEIIKCFGDVSRFERAKSLSNRNPFIYQYLPKPRRIWESESASMLLFDAAALLKAKGLL